MSRHCGKKKKNQRETILSEGSVVQFLQFVEWLNKARQTKADSVVRLFVCSGTQLRFHLLLGDNTDGRMHDGTKSCRTIVGSTKGTYRVIRLKKCEN